MSKLNLKKITRDFISAINNNKFLLFLLTLSFLSSAFATPSGDILSNAKQTITSNFGVGSTIIYIVYVIEIFAGIAAYIKTKNLFALIGLVVVVIFTTIAFGILGS